MKVVHVPYCFYPDPIGGAEIYVASLLKSLRRLDVDGLIAAPGSENKKYRHHTIEVWRFAINQEARDMLAELYGGGDAFAARNFANILDEEKPDVVHVHAFTRAVSLRLVHEAKQRRIPLVFTYHTPTVSCQRGTLMRFGVEVCDGKVDLTTCTRCTLQGLGTNGLGGKLLSNLPPSLGSIFGALHLSGRAATGLRMTSLLQSRHAAFCRLMETSDAVVVLCEWAKQLLIRNGVSPRKITLSRHGLDRVEVPETETAEVSSHAKVLRVAFFGRMHETKGADVLVKALLQIPVAAIELDLYGIVQGQGDSDYLERLRRLASGDSRVNFKAPVENERVSVILRDYDLLAVPSRCLETGPLVVLEAFAAGIPVIGSDLGGIAELIKNGVNGLLVRTNSVSEWANALQRCEHDRCLIMKMRSVSQPRKMIDIAAEMKSLYRRVFSREVAASTAA